MKYVFLPEDSLIADGNLRLMSETVIPGNSQVTKLMIEGRLGLSSEFEVSFKSFNGITASGSYLEVLEVNQNPKHLEVFVRVSGQDLFVKAGSILATAVISEKIAVKTMPKVTTEVSYTPTYSLDVPAKKTKKKR